MMTLVFFLEEPSAQEMLKGILPKILPENIQPRFVIFDGKQDLERQLVRSRPSKTAFKASSAFGPQQSAFSVNTSLKPPMTGRLDEKRCRFRIRFRGQPLFPKYSMFAVCYVIFCAVFGPRNQRYIGIGANGDRAKRF